MQLTPLIAVHMTAALTAICIGPIALWARKGSTPQTQWPKLHRAFGYLRATLQASRSTCHSLADEFDRLSDYLALMAVRMGPRLVFTLDLPLELAAQQVPTLLLQPLVENAIKHGLEPKIEGGSIAVSARREGKTIVLDVIDSGVGLKDGAGFGLTHVRERLQATYGGQAAIYLGAGYANSTWASITFPSQNACKTYGHCTDR